MKVIYTPRGKAREYADLALNLYTGCPGRCRYCYVPQAVHKDRIEFHCTPEPRMDKLPLIIKDISDLGENIGQEFVDGHGEPYEKYVPPIFLCFTSDPYPLPNSDLTSTILECLSAYGLHWTVLTKFPTRAAVDFPLYRPGDSFGVTLTSLDITECSHWEPACELPAKRLRTLRLAKEGFGMATWISLEPVIEQADTLEIIQESISFTDSYKIGALNYCKDGPRYSPDQWQLFLTIATRLITAAQKTYYIKKSLQKYLPKGIPHDTRKTA